MPAVALYHPLTLPRGWPRRIRSVAVQVVSLADLALTAALGWAAQGLNPASASGRNASGTRSRF